MKICKYCGKEIIEKKRKFCNLECRKSFYDSEEEKEKRREYMREYNKKYYDEESNRQKRKEYMNNYMKEYLQNEEHHEKHKQMVRKHWNSIGQEKKKEYRKDFIERHPRYFDEKRKVYIENNRDKWNAYCRERYHRMKLQKKENENAKEI